MKGWKSALIAGTGLAIVYGFMKVAAKKKNELSDIDNDNPYIVSDYSISTCDGQGDYTDRKTGIYEGKVKPAMDKILSFTGLVILSPLFGLIALAIVVDDPGPVFFIQKRIGKNGHYFMCHKFRSMKTFTPGDVPTHMLADSQSYITRVGKFLRYSSLDELPQLWDIWRGRMSLIGPRPALWNQDDLVEARSHCKNICGERIDANTVLPGLTGLAQIRGRDQLEIPVKADFDGEYVSALTDGGFKAFSQDAKLFFYTVASVLKHDGVVEGGSGGITSNLQNSNDHTKMD